MSKKALKTTTVAADAATVATVATVAADAATVAADAATVAAEVTAVTDAASIFARELSSLVSAEKTVASTSLRVMVATCVFYAGEGFISASDRSVQTTIRNRAREMALGAGLGESSWKHIASTAGHCVGLETFRAMLAKPAAEAFDAMLAHFGDTPWNKVREEYRATGGKAARTTNSTAAPAPEAGPADIAKPDTDAAITVNQNTVLAWFENQSPDVKAYMMRLFLDVLPAGILAEHAADVAKRMEAATKPQAIAA